MVASAGVIYPLAWQQHEEEGARVHIKAIERAWSSPSASVSARGSTASRGPSSKSCPSPPGTGILRIATLGVTAPVEQGVSDSVLSDSVGHEPGTPWPGQPGTSELLAHDVGFFASNGELKPGDLVTYEDACDLLSFRVVGHYVLDPGQSFKAPGTHGVALISCWPPDALWWTNQRLIVTAGLIRTTPKEKATPGESAAQKVEPLPPSVPAQPFLFDDGWLAGTMVVIGADPAWKNGPLPLRWESVGLDALAAVHFGLQEHASWLSALAPRVHINPGFADPPTTVPVSVVERVSGSRLESVTLSTVLGGESVDVVVVPDGKWSLVEEAGTP